MSLENMLFYSDGIRCEYIGLLPTGLNIAFHSARSFIMSCVELKICLNQLLKADHTYFTIWHRNTFCVNLIENRK